MKDDRAEFEVSKRADAARMAADAALMKTAGDLMIAADRYNYTYQWSWLGLPIIQTPEDIIALQEIFWRCQPTVVVETGVARGGSVLFFASLMQLAGRGRVIGVELDMRPHNRDAIASHQLGARAELIEGSSIAPDTVAAVRARITPEDRVMVVLDSNHTHEHVLEELRLYAPLVTAGQYLIVADTVVEDMPEQLHRPRPWGPGNNPATALTAYQRETDVFELDRAIADKLLMTSSRRGYMRRVR